MSDQYATADLTQPPAPPPQQAPAPEPQRPADPNQAGFERAIAGIEGNQARTEQDYLAYRSALAPQIARLQSSMGGGPKIPQQQKLPDAPNPQDYQKGALAFAGAMALLGAVGSARTRGMGGASMAAFTGAMKGWQEGSHEAYENAAKQWEQNTRKTIENNQMELQKYKMILENKKLNIDQQMSLIQVQAAQFHDAMMMNAAREKNFTMVGNLYLAKSAAEQKAQQAVDTLSERRNKDQQTLEKQGAYWLTPEGTARRAELTPEQNANIDKLITMAGMGVGGKGGVITPDKDAYAQFNRENPDATAEQKRNFLQSLHPARSAAGMAAERFKAENPNFTAKQLQEFNAEQVAIQRFLSGPQGNTTRSLGVVVDHLDTVKQLSDALHNGNTQVINRAMQAIATHFGSEEPTDLVTAGHIVGPEIVKALGVAGAGTQGEREAAGAQFSNAKSPAQIDGAIRTVMKLMGGQLRGLQGQFLVSTGLPVEKFNAMVGQRGLQALESSQSSTIAAQSLGGAGKPPASGPPVGHIEEGYRFKGGDPSDKNNWEKM